MTHTYAEMAVSKSAYDEVKVKLLEAGYKHSILSDGSLDMHGIALTPQALPLEAIESALPPTPILQIMGIDGAMLVKIKSSGELEYGPNYIPDEAARTFWMAIATAFPNHLAKVTATYREQNLAMMIRMLCASTANPGTRTRGMELLRGMGLQGSPLR